MCMVLTMSKRPFDLISKILILGFAVKLRS
jgi:hypothetical protein